VGERLAHDEDRVVRLFLAESCDDAPADMLLEVVQWWTGSVSDELRFSWVGLGFRPGPGGKVISAVSRPPVSCDGGGMGVQVETCAESGPAWLVPGGGAHRVRCLPPAPPLGAAGW
jgi:hypothetical protein